MEHWTQHMHYRASLSTRCFSFIDDDRNYTLFDDLYNIHSPHLFSFQVLTWVPKNIWSANIGFPESKRWCWKILCSCIISAFKKLVVDPDLIFVFKTETSFKWNFPIPVSKVPNWTTEKKPTYDEASSVDPQGEVGSTFRFHIIVSDSSAFF